MKTLIINNIEYKLPGFLNSFQLDLYLHLIDWKWKHISKDPGEYHYNGKTYWYDAILPMQVRDEFPLIYPMVLDKVKKHQKFFPFKFHEHFNHMASSQAANLNLFLPILINPKANEILALLKSDFKRLATDELFNGFRIEFWDNTIGAGLLGDHNARSGTDSDIAIAYYNHQDELCLWLVEHKLTEKEFTICGGFKSSNRDRKKHQCEKSFSEILDNKNLCYYHDVRKFEYWNLSYENQSFFVNHDKVEGCPFKNGSNQL